MSSLFHECCRGFGTGIQFGEVLRGVLTLVRKHGVSVDANYMTLVTNVSADRNRNSRLRSRRTEHSRPHSRRVQHQCQWWAGGGGALRGARRGKKGGGHWSAM
jgi:hypothetical protein